MRLIVYRATPIKKHFIIDQDQALEEKYEVAAHDQLFTLNGPGRRGIITIHAG